MSVGKNESKCQNTFFSINDLHSNLDLFLPTDMMRKKKNFKLDSSWYDVVYNLEHFLCWLGFGVCVQTEEKLSRIEAK